MNNFSKNLIILIILYLPVACSSPAVSENVIISMKTTLGDIKIKLYDDTPLHRDNFIKLINSGFYEDISFHRVIKNFMIQAGDPDTRSTPSKLFPDTIKTYTIPAEFTTNHFHMKGALAAARQGNSENPEMRSSGTQFYIVQGIKYNDTDLNQAELIINSNIKQGLFNKLMKEISDSIRISGKEIDDGEVQELASVKMFEYLTTNNEFKIPEEQRLIYRTIGGVPRLDGTYTVFGEVIEGLDIVDKIAAVPTDRDKPLNDIKIIKIKILNR